MIKFFIILFLVVFLTLGFILDTTKQPVKSDAIFCLGGSDLYRIQTSLHLLHSNYSSLKKVYYSGLKGNILWQMKKKSTVTISKNDLDLNIQYIKNLHTTMDEINYICSIINKYHYKRVMIVTSPPHSRRVSILIKKFAKSIDNKYILVSSNPPWWNKYFYFIHTRALLYSFLEINKTIYDYIKYSYFKNSKLTHKVDSIVNNLKSYLYINYNI